METILLKLFLCMMCVIVEVNLLSCLFWLWRELFRTWREKKAKRKEGCPQQKKTTWLPEPPVLLSPKERREYMLNHIEDGRFYAISSLCRSDTTIVCAKRYDAEEERLYCYAYLWISGNGHYNLHVIDPRDTSQSCKFLGGKSLRIGFDINPRCVVFEEENISPYLTERDYNDIVQSLQKAGFDWKIEKGKENVLGSYEYLLKETGTK